MVVYDTESASTAIEELAAVGESIQHAAPFGQGVAEIGPWQFDAELGALAHHVGCAFGGIVRGVLQQRFRGAVAALVETEQDARGEFGGGRLDAQFGAALEVVQERFQCLVENFVSRLGRMDVALAAVIAGPAVEFPDVLALQGGFDVVRNRVAVLVRHE